MTRFAILVVSIFLAACAAAPNYDSAPAAPQQGATNLVEEYLIGVDDVVEVTVWRNPDLNATVPVRPDGKISVPLIGDVDAGGKTPEQVADVIKEQLSVYIKEPLVAVILTQLNSHEYLSRVRVTGAVRTPITIPYRQGMTVLDAVLAAGGPNEFASLDRSRLIRKTPDEVGTFNVVLGDILNRGDLTTNFSLRPGDVITVPERTL
ncbi:MAG: XrtA/PEP-CTERM system exopolysaccharide export protein [Lysobacterales bacterium]